MGNELWVFHGDEFHPASKCKDCEDCIKIDKAFEEFKKTQEYQDLINPKK